MNRKNIKFAGVIIGGVVIFFIACSSSLHLTNVWVDPSYKLGPMKSLLVISINKDPVKRRLWEDAFASELTQHGVVVTPSYRLFSGAPPDTNQITDAVARDKYSGVVFVSPLPTQTQSTMVQPYVSSEPVTRYNPWRDMYSTRYVQVMHPGYVQTSKVVGHEVDVWSASGKEQMVWSATCTITDPVSYEQVYNETINAIVHQLARAAIISSE